MACAQNEEACLSLCSLRSLWQEEKKNYKEHKDHKEPDAGGCAGRVACAQNENEEALTRRSRLLHFLWSGSTEFRRTPLIRGRAPEVMLPDPDYDY
jgi:hypothetical protein